MLQRYVPVRTARKSAVRILCKPSSAIAYAPSSIRRAYRAKRTKYASAKAVIDHIKEIRGLLLCETGEVEKWLVSAYRAQQNPAAAPINVN
jgi:hypothetical protein